MTNNYAEQLGYTNDLELLLDFYKIDDLHTLLDSIVHFVSATEQLDAVFNEHVEDLVMSNVNLKSDVKEME